MRSLGLACFAALILTGSFGCQQSELPSAPPPVGGDTAGTTEVAAPSTSDAAKNIMGEGATPAVE